MFYCNKSHFYYIFKIAISVGRGAAGNVVGIATIDLNSPTLHLCQINDNMFFGGLCIKINYFQPLEIIMPSTILGSYPTPKIVTIIQQMTTASAGQRRRPYRRLVAFDRRHFNEANALEQLQKLCANTYKSDVTKCSHEYFAMSSASALMKYVQYSSGISFADASLKIQFDGKYAAMSIGEYR